MDFRVPEHVLVKRKRRIVRNESVRLGHKVRTLGGEFPLLGGAREKIFWTSQMGDLNFRDLFNHSRRKSVIKNI